MAGMYDIVGSVLRAGLARLSRRRLPQIEGRLNVAGLHAPVEIIRDRWGIPHIYASDAHDLVFAQGFAHAQDRLWQMEVNRRVATGRLSELFGEVTLPTDRAVRTLGLNRLGREDWASADPQVREVVLAYTQGINAYLRSRWARMPVEFTLLRYTPEPWVPEEIMAFTRMMTWQLSGGWYGQIMRARLIEAVGPEAAAELEIHALDDDPLTLPAGVEFNRLSPESLLPGLRDSSIAQGVGSNAWAVSGRKTTTGAPILAGDPHLHVTTPSVWYQVHLVGGGLNVSGVSLPGLPLVVIGHNERIAWGITLAWTDCQDLFVEQIDPQNPRRYRFGGDWLDAEVVPELIQVKGRSQPHVEEVVLTRHGPLISDVVGYPEQRLALSAMNLRPGLQNLKGWLQLNQAAGWDGFVEGMRGIEGAQLNVVYADADGNIGYWVAGKVPIRANGRGLVPAPGWTGEHEWIGEVPFDEMPHALNPAQGYVVSCNQRVISDDYPYFLGNIWNNGYRARRAIELLESKAKVSFDDCRAMQVDLTCAPGLEFVKLLEGVSSQDADVRAALDRLRAWDGKLTTATVGGTLYEVTRDFLFRNLLEPALGKDLTTRVQGQSFDPALYPLSEYWTHEVLILLRILGNPDSWWLRQAGGREAVVTRSIKQAVEHLRGRLGPDVDTWTWGRIHQINFLHAMGSQEPLDRVFNPRMRPVGGDGDTLFVTALNPGDPANVIRFVAPSCRHIVDLGDLSRAVGVCPPGQSGQLGSPHYDDLIDPWINGEYHPLLWTREQVEREAEGKLTLAP